MWELVVLARPSLSRVSDVLLFPGRVQLPVVFQGPFVGWRCGEEWDKGRREAHTSPGTFLGPPAADQVQQPGKLREQGGGGGGGGWGGGGRGWVGREGG